jgi:hypothetical protein
MIGPWWWMQSSLRRTRSKRDQVVRIFTSTFNAGSSSGLAALGPIEEWIPLGYDLYVIVRDFRESHVFHLTIGAFVCSMLWIPPILFESPECI